MLKYSCLFIFGTDFSVDVVFSLSLHQKIEVMNPKEWQVLMEREQFVQKETSLADFVKRPYRLQFGMNMLCISGQADFSVNLSDHSVKKGSVVIILPNNLLDIHRISPDFRAKVFFFSETLFHESTFRLEGTLFKYIAEHPFSDLDEHAAAEVGHWMRMAEYTYGDRDNIHRLAITRNRLQSVFLEYDNKIRSLEWCDEGRPAISSRRTDLFHRFMKLVHHYCCRQHDVTFYADKLCISSRYLTAICRAVLGRSAKEMIDGELLLEIKIRLRSTDLSIQEIADETYFPDQSYLGRFFKRHTGQSPTAYRMSGQ